MLGPLGLTPSIRQSPLRDVLQSHASGAAEAAPGSFLETFDGNPAAPQPWNPSTWDVTVHGLESYKYITPMQASHGPDCGAPPATHPIGGPQDPQGMSSSVFLCRDHVMTSMDAGYGLVYLTPNQMVDVSGGEAVIRWDMSTLRTSSRDWVDLLITPFEGNMQLAGRDGQEPPTGLLLQMENTSAVPIFWLYDRRNGTSTRVGGGDPSYAKFLPDMSAVRRDTFEFRVSRTHVKFGMPAYNVWWVDADIAPLDFTQGVVAFGHHAYNPEKDCAGGYTASCGPGTWHWDNVSISPAAPFTILRADRRYVDQDAAPPEVRFPAAAPVGSFLRFSGIGPQLQVSFDGGATWRTAERPFPLNKDEHFESYWMAAPTGTTSVRFRSASPQTNTQWAAKDIALWSREAAGSGPAPAPPVPQEAASAAEVAAEPVAS
jgi:hypothetical protein